MTMTCCLKKSHGKHKKGKPILPATSEERIALALRQAPKFYVPARRYECKCWLKTEEALKQTLENNNYYPFAVASPLGVYRLQYTQDRFWYGIGLFTGFFIALWLFVLWVTSPVVGPQRPATSTVVLWDFSQFTLLPFIICAGYFGACWIFSKHWVNTLYLDAQSRTYEVYHGQKLHYRGHFHNIYIRLKCLQTVKDRKRREKGDRTLYYLTINGYHLSTIYLSSHSKNYKEMRKLGRRIASNFNLNFIDKDFVSKHHVIRHRCPYGLAHKLDAEGDLWDGFTNVLYNESASVTGDRRRSSARPRGRGTIVTDGSKGGLIQTGPEAHTRKSVAASKAVNKKSP